MLDGLWFNYSSVLLVGNIYIKFYYEFWISIVIVKAIFSMVKGVDDNAHVYVRFIGIKYKLKVVVLDTTSAVFVINKMISRVLRRHIKMWWEFTNDYYSAFGMVS